MSSSEANKIDVRCSCGRKLRAPATAAGRKAKCPGCGNVLTITAPATEESDAEDLYALADDEKIAAPRVPTAPAPSEAAQPANAGTLSGPIPSPRVPAVPRISPAASKPKVVDAMAPQGSFFAGVGMSALFAAGGGLLWFLIAYFFDAELAFVALLIGGGAGVGMQMGQKGYSTLGGIAAAGITFLTIVITKIIVFLAIIFSYAEHYDVEERDWAAIEHLQHEELKRSGTDLETASEEEVEAAEESATKKFAKMSDAEKDEARSKGQEMEDREELVEYLRYDLMKGQTPQSLEREGAYAAFEKQAEKQVDAMTPEKRKQELARYREAEEAEERALEAEAAAAAAAESEDDEDNGGSSAIATGIFVLILLFMFGWWSLIFMIMAMFFAYRTAAGSVHG